MIKITERQFHGDQPGNPAYLRQRMFLVVREPVRTYRESRLLYDGPDAERLDEQYDLMFPFEAVRDPDADLPVARPTREGRRRRPPRRARSGPASAASRFGSTSPPRTPTATRSTWRCR